MRIIRTLSDLDAHFDPAVKTLLCLRMEMLADYGADLACFVIPDPGDTIADVEQAIAFPLADWECVLDHGGIFEAPYVTDDYGHGYILLVPAEQGIDPALLAACRAHAQAANPNP